MTKLITALVIGTSTALVFASPAMAEENQPQTTVEAKTAVLASVETADKTMVRDEDGNVFYNHYVPEDELFEVDYDVEVIDTYTVTYEGRTYINRVVTE